MEPIAKQTRRALAHHPHVIETLAEGTVNVSATARMLAADLEANETAAIASALRRLADELEPVEQEERPRIRIDRDISTHSQTIPSQFEAFAFDQAYDSLAIVSATGLPLSDHRVALGRLAVRGVSPAATAHVNGTSHIVIEEQMYPAVLESLEAPISPAVRGAILSRTIRGNTG